MKTKIYAPKGKARTEQSYPLNSKILNPGSPDRDTALMTSWARKLPRVEQVITLIALQIVGKLCKSKRDRKDSSILLFFNIFIVINLRIFLSSSVGIKHLFSWSKNALNILLLTYVFDNGKCLDTILSHDFWNICSTDGNVIVFVILSFGGSFLYLKSEPKSEINQPSKPKVPEIKLIDWGEFWRHALFIRIASA